MPHDPRCWSCGARDVRDFYEVRGIPAHSCLLMPTPEEAVAYPRRDLALGFCEACGFIQNTAFDPTVHEYSPRYEETQGFSGRFNRFAGELARRLVFRHDLRGKDIVEIGCGKGEFLRLLCEIGDNRGVGIDPAWRPDRVPEGRAGDRGSVRFIPQLYSPEHADLPADLILCRHTLEHIQPVAELLRLVRESIGAKDTVVVVEVPDVGRVLRERAFWDIYYEHCSYFSPGSLAHLFRSSGFDVQDLSLDFGDQYILIDARPGGGLGGVRSALEDDLGRLADDVRRFEVAAPDRVEGWRESLARARERGQHVALWGSGSKAVSFLTTLGVRDEVGCVVDVNPFKQGMYMPGTGHPIVAPERLKTYRPDAVVAMNPVYLDEIRREMRGLGVEAELVAV